MYELFIRESEASELAGSTRVGFFSSVTIHVMVIALLVGLSGIARHVPRRPMALNTTRIYLYPPKNASPKKTRIDTSDPVAAPVVEHLFGSPAHSETTLVQTKVQAAGFDRSSDQVQTAEFSGVIRTDLFKISDGHAMTSAGPVIGRVSSSRLFSEDDEDKSSGSGGRGGNSNGARGSGPGDQRARLLSTPVPVYTEAARRTGITGEVIILAQLMVSGRVHAIRVVSGLGMGLDEAAVDAVNRTLCSPATKAGVPYEVIGTIRVTFKLA